MSAKKLFNAGFTELVSVIPPGAELSPMSKVKPESAGKAPGRKNAQGRWVGYAWQTEQFTEADAETLEASGGNIGIKAGLYPGVDIDCTDEAISLLIENLSKQHLGDAPVRVGQAPKRLLMYRAAEPFGRMRLWFRVGEKQHLIEVLGEGQQYVVAGVHPRTMKPYRWTYGTATRDYPPLRPAKLTEITREKVDTFLQAVEAELDLFDIACQREGSGNVGDKRTTPQESLKARDLDLLADAVAVIPNDTPSRDDYVKMGYAIKAAAQEDEERGYQIFLDWCLKWEGGDNDPATVRGDWERMHPPYEIGADWIYDQAARHGFNSAVTEFVATETAPEDEDDDEIDAAELSDIWVAERFMEKHGHEVRWVPAWGKFMFWNGQCWRRDEMQKIPSMVIGVCKEISDRLLRSGTTDKEKGANQKKAVQICSAGTVQSVQTLLKMEGSLIAPAEVMDADPWVLGTPGGTVDLKTGEILPAEPMRNISKLAAITPIYRGTTPIWREFLATATSGDDQLVAYLQRLAGYSLTGLVSEQTLAFLWGPGGNGKSVFVNTIAGILGEYAKVAPMETFTASLGDRHPTELAGLQGARLVTASETQEGRAWDEAKVKAITGGDRITARYMHRDFFTYDPTFKLVFLGNHKPAIGNLDDAMRRRFHMVPFTVRPAVVNRQLFDQLKQEWPAILGWMIEGCLAWQREGLNPPAAVLEATKTYFEEEDPIGRWLAERTSAVSDEADEDTLKDLFQDFQNWAADNGERKITGKKFSQLLYAKGYEKGGRKGGSGLTKISGLGLKPYDLDAATKVLARM